MPFAIDAAVTQQQLHILDYYVSQKKKEKRYTIYQIYSKSIDI